RHVFWNFFFNDPATSVLYTLSLHDALPISGTGRVRRCIGRWSAWGRIPCPDPCVPERTLAARQRTPGDLELRSRAVALLHPSERSEEHTSELQSRFDLVCRLLLEKKN